jgi:hypothetical protein
VSAPTTTQWLRTAVIRVGEGSTHLALHLGRRAAARVWGVYTGARDWVGKSSGLDKAFRLGLLALAVLVVRKTSTALGRWAYGRIESGAWWPLLFGAAGVWIVAAYRAGRPGWAPKPPKTKPAPAAEEASETELERADPDDGEQPPTVSLEKQLPPLPILPDLRISLAKVGTPHAHLAVLAADIGTTAERVREALDKWQIPVEAVRMHGRGTSTGVKGGPAVHPALAPRPEDAAVVAAGQPGNNNSNNAFTTVDDEENPVRTHVLWHAQQSRDPARATREESA